LLFPLPHNAAYCFVVVVVVVVGGCYHSSTPHHDENGWSDRRSAMNQHSLINTGIEDKFCSS